VKTLRLPEGNKKDVAELPEPAKKGLKIFTHKHIDEIVKILFAGVKVAKVDAAKADAANASKVGEPAEANKAASADKSAAKPAKKSVKKTAKKK